jgi:hypothetical protein
LTEAFPWDTAPRYLLGDRDASYGQTFRDRVEAMGIEEVVTATRGSSFAGRTRGAGGSGFAGRTSRTGGSGFAGRTRGAGGSGISLVLSRLSCASMMTTANHEQASV